MYDKAARNLGWGAIVLGLASLMLVAVSAYGYRQEVWPVLRALDIAALGAWAAGAGGLAGLTGLGVWLRGGQGGGRASAIGLGLSLPVLIAAGFWQYSTLTTPPMNDISTDTADPPVFWFTVTPTDYPSGNASLQHAAYPDVRPLKMPLTFDEAFALALFLVEAKGWTVLSADPAETQIEAIATSALFGFDDEVVIRVSETETGVTIDMRSRSRIGQIDRGANARRIKAFLSDMEARANS